MAVAEIIGAAFGVLLLVIVAYVLVGGTLSMSETVATAQKDLTLQNEARIRTDIQINQSEISIVGSGLRFSVKNSGNEIVSDFSHMDIYTYNAALGYQYYTYDPYNTGIAGNWTITSFEKDFVHPGMLDPGEKMWVAATFPGTPPQQLQVTTSKGVSASTVI
jgi:archaeal flagellar protein FlaF